MADQPLRRPVANLSRIDFIRRYGAIYERSPWVASSAYDKAIKAVTLKELQAALREAVDNATDAQKMQLITAHPDLVIGAADPNLSAHSAAEQQGAGLTQCTPEEFTEFTDLNNAYKKKFGFPFIIAVKGLQRPDILAAFKRRIENSRVGEYHAALDQIHKIAAFRLAALEEEPKK